MGQWLALKRGTEDARGPETTQDPHGWENKNHAPVGGTARKMRLAFTMFRKTWGI